jgi:hypothetical protein
MFGWVYQLLASEDGVPTFANSNLPPVSRKAMGFLIPTLTNLNDSSLS